ncbi:MAG TPA: peptidoglycan DD-metalloendopeptidase family protein [Steroidobacteraceae bacterium]|jgi:septal ring factor EnvC (AmiA/AmiB activator)|nr:peptidoglycan DD-metalloendopeptidase family protein [Steroidobacteraceae bacterium]
MGEPRRFVLQVGLAVAAATILAAAGDAAPPQAQPPAAAAGSRQAQTEAQLQALKGQIATFRDKVSQDAVASDRAAQALQAAEVAVAAARGRLADLRHERAARSADRASAAAQKRSREAAVAEMRAGLAQQLRAAYMIGREEPLKLLLNQQDPARAGRMFAYYSYFGRARAGVIAAIDTDIRALATLDAQLAADEQRLDDLQTATTDELAQLETARAQRDAALLTIKADSRNSSQALQRLQAQQGALTALLRDLKRALAPFPSDANGAFGNLRGRLTWPVGGHLAARFGQVRAGGLKWDGMLIDTERGADVRAVYRGRVIYADWLPGLGLLTIIDHGDGYLSLYGHNDRLYKAVGDTVSAGDVIAASGDSGGSSRPQLYFEIRKGSRPVDPGPWFRQAGPVAN